MKCWILLFLILYSHAALSGPDTDIPVQPSFHFPTKNTWSFMACAKQTKSTPSDEIAIINASIDLVYQANKALFEKQGISRRDLCVEIVKDVKLNAWVINTQTDQGIVHVTTGTLKDTKRFEEITSVIAHELGHILLDASNYFDASSLPANLQDLWQQYHNSERRLYDTSNAVRTELNKIINDPTVQSKNFLKRLNDDGFFGAWQYPELNDEFIKRVSLKITPQERQSLQLDASQHVFANYLKLGALFRESNEAYYQSKETFEASYNEKFGEYRFESFDELEADRLGYVLYRRIGLDPSLFFTNEYRQIAFIKWHTCSKAEYSQNVAIDEDATHPKECFRQASLVKFDNENRGYFSSFSQSGETAQYVNYWQNRLRNYQRGK